MNKSQIIRFTKGLLKRSAKIVSLYRKAWWIFFYFQNYLGTKVLRRARVVATPAGYKLAIGYHLSYRLMRTGQYEVNQTSLFQRLMPLTDVFVDVGANIGYFSCIALMSNKHTVIVEPQQQNLRYLFKTLYVNGWQDQAEVHPVAVSDKVGLLPLFGASGPAASLLPGWAGFSPRHRQIVPVLTLQDIIDNRFAGQRLLVKIDVEGVEYQVMQGALPLLTHDPQPIWLMEICLDRCHPGGVHPHYKQIFDLFWQNGYEAYTATGNPEQITQSIIDRWIEEKSGDTEYNILFVGTGQVLADIFDKKTAGKILRD